MALAFSSYLIRYFPEVQLTKVLSDDGLPPLAKIKFDLESAALADLVQEKNDLNQKVEEMREMLRIDYSKI